MNYPLYREYVWGFLLFFLLSLLRLLHHGDRVGGQEVYSLTDVVGLGEATMIGFEESADVVSWALIGFEDRDSSVDEFERVDHEGDAVKQSLFAILLTILFFNISIEFFLVFSWHHIPSFNSPFVIIVQGVHPQVLHVPAEC